MRPLPNDVHELLLSGASLSTAYAAAVLLAPALPAPGEDAERERETTPAPSGVRRAA